MMHFVGEARHGELELVLGAWRRCQSEGEPQMLVLSAPSGWGKTRLVQELYRTLASSQPADQRYWPPTIDEGWSSASTTTARKVVFPRTVPLSEHDVLPQFLWLGIRSTASDGMAAPLLDDVERQLHRHLAGVLRRLEREEASEELIQTITRAVVTAVPGMNVFETPRSIQEVRAAYLTYRASGVSTAHHRHDDLLAPDQSRVDGVLQLFDNLVFHPDGAARATPVVLAIDDAHDLDSEALRLVQGLVALGGPLLIVATAWPELVEADRGRDDRFGGWLLQAIDDGASFEVRSLAPLRSEELQEALLALLPATDPHVAYGLSERADGNPLLLQGFLELDAVGEAIREHAVELSDADIEALPRDLSGLTSRRWHALQPSVRRLLAAASVQGEVFLAAVLASSWGEPFGQNDLDAATELQWVRNELPEAGVHRFVERLLFDVAAANARGVANQEDWDSLCRAALAVAAALLDDSDPTVWLVARKVYVRVVELGVQGDVVVAARCADDLGERCRVEGERKAACRLFERASSWYADGGSVHVDSWARTSAKAVRLTRIAGDAPRSIELGVALVKRAEQVPGLSDAALAVIHRELGMSLRKASPPDIEGARSALETAEQALLRSKDALAADRCDVEELAIYLDEETRNGAPDIQRIRGFVDRCEAELGRLHVTTLDAIQMLGFRLARVDAEEALVVRREYLDRSIERRGGVRRHVVVAGALADMASSLARLGYFNEAIGLADEAVELRSRVFGERNVYTLRVRSVRASVRRKWARAHLARDRTVAEAVLDEVIAELREILEAKEQNSGRASETYTGSQMVLGEALLDRGQPDKAAGQFRSVLEFRRSNLRRPVGHFTVQAAASALARALIEGKATAVAQQIREEYSLGEA